MFRISKQWYYFYYVKELIKSNIISQIRKVYVVVGDNSNTMLVFDTVFCIKLIEGFKSEPSLGILPLAT